MGTEIKAVSKRPLFTGALTHLFKILLSVLAITGALSSASAAPPPNLPPVYVGVEIKSFTVDAAGAVPAGRTIHISLFGSPGGKASFAIPNIAGFTPMKETSPGLYQGTYKTTSEFQTVNARVIGQLVGKDGTMAPVFATPQMISIDADCPKLVHETPADRDIVIGSRPVIYCGFDDGGGSGVSPHSVKLQIDGVDVEDKAVQSPSGISYQPTTPLAPGIHAMYVFAADRAGNPVQDIWHFTVAQPTPMPTFTGDKLGALQEGDKLNLTLIADPGLKPVFRVEPLRQIFPLKEVQPGHYTGMFTPRQGDSVNAAPVIARFEEGGNRYVISLDRQIDIKSANPAKPKFTMPGPDDDFGRSIEMGGKCLPYNTVICEISYNGRGLSGEFPFVGLALRQVAYADSRGIWHMGPFDLNLASLYGKNMDSHLVLIAYTQDAAGNESFPETITLDYTP